jgi:hypothetical protein
MRDFNQQGIVIQSMNQSSLQDLNLKIAETLLSFIGLEVQTFSVYWVPETSG